MQDIVRRLYKKCEWKEMFLFDLQSLIFIFHYYTITPVIIMESILVRCVENSNLTKMEYLFRRRIVEYYEQTA